MPRPIDRIHIEFIPHRDQRYDTVGDWQIFPDNGITELVISVSRMPGNPLFEQAVALHELTEALLCDAAGISQKVVDAWDMEVAADSLDPGTEPGCPYAEQHAIALLVEQKFLNEAGIDWDTYNDYLDLVFKDSQKG